MDTDQSLADTLAKLSALSSLVDTIGAFEAGVDAAEQLEAGYMEADDHRTARLWGELAGALEVAVECYRAILVNYTDADS